MRALRNLRAWLFGCHATTIDPSGLTFWCTLVRAHEGVHEAHVCGCAGGGRCADGPVEAWRP